MSVILALWLALSRSNGGSDMTNEQYWKLQETARTDAAAGRTPPNNLTTDHQRRVYTEARNGK